MALTGEENHPFNMTPSGCSMEGRFERVAWRALSEGTGLRGRP